MGIADKESRYCVNHMCLSSSEVALTHVLLYNDKSLTDISLSLNCIMFEFLVSTLRKESRGIGEICLPSTDCQDQFVLRTPSPIRHAILISSLFDRLPYLFLLLY